MSGYDTQLKILHTPQMKNGHPRLLSRATSDSRLYGSAVFNCNITTVKTEASVQGETLGP